MKNLNVSILIRKIVVQFRTTSELESYFGMKWAAMKAEVEKFFEAFPETKEARMEALMEQLVENDRRIPVFVSER